MIRERASRVRNDADAKVPEAERMAFMVREMDKANIANYRAKKSSMPRPGPGPRGGRTLERGKGSG